MTVASVFRRADLFPLERGDGFGRVRLGFEDVLVVLALGMYRPGHLQVSMPNSRALVKNFRILPNACALQNAAPRYLPLKKKS